MADTFDFDVIPETDLDKLENAYIENVPQQEAYAAYDFWTLIVLLMLFTILLVSIASWMLPADVDANDAGNPVATEQ